jgi:DNA-binding MarR family transcriptional regulator
MTDKHQDHLDQLVSQWRVARPDLEDVEAMAVVARLLHVARLIGERLSAHAAEHRLSVGEADVLFTLRRAGPPHLLSPTQIASSVLVATGTMTSRLDVLESRGLLRRLPDPEDRRGLRIELTASGLQLVDAVVGEHLGRERDLLAVLNPRERQQLAQATRKLLAYLEATPAS